MIPTKLLAAGRDGVGNSWVADCRNRHNVQGRNPNLKPIAIFAILRRMFEEILRFCPSGLAAALHDDGQFTRLNRTSIAQRRQPLPRSRSPSIPSAGAGGMHSALRLVNGQPTPLSRCPCSRTVEGVVSVPPGVSSVQLRFQVRLPLQRLRTPAAARTASRPGPTPEGR